MSGRKMKRLWVWGISSLTLGPLALILSAPWTVCQVPAGANNGAANVEELHQERIPHIPHKYVSYDFDCYWTVFLAGRYYAQLDNGFAIYQFDYERGGKLDRRLVRQIELPENFIDICWEIMERFGVRDLLARHDSSSAVFPLRRENEFLLYGGSPRSFHLFKWRSPDSLEPFEGIHPGRGTVPKFATRAPYIALVRLSKDAHWRVEVWNLDQRKCEFAKPAVRSDLLRGDVRLDVDISPSGNRVAFYFRGFTHTWEESLWVWNVRTGELVFRETRNRRPSEELCKHVSGHLIAGRSIAFVGEDGGRIIVETGRCMNGFRYIDLDNKRIIWDLPCACMATGEVEIFHPISVSHDGRWLVTGGVLWDLEDATPIGQFSSLEPLPNAFGYYLHCFVPDCDGLYYDNYGISDLFTPPPREASLKDYPHMVASMEESWRRFISENPHAAFLALQAFLSRPKETPSFLMHKLKDLSRARLGNLSPEEFIKRLDSPHFFERESIQRVVLNSGIEALELVRQTESKKHLMSAEVARRFNHIRRQILLAARPVRWSLACLEYLGNPESEAVLRWAADNLNDHSLRAEATASLERLQRKRSRR